MTGTKNMAIRKTLPIKPIANTIGTKMSAAKHLSKQTSPQEQHPLYLKASSMKTPASAKGGPRTNIKGKHMKIPRFFKKIENLLLFEKCCPGHPKIFIES